MTTGAGASDLLHAEDAPVDEVLAAGEEQIVARSPLQLFWRRLRRDKVSIAALMFIGLLVFVAVFAGPITARVRVRQTRKSPIPERKPRASRKQAFLKQANAICKTARKKLAAEFKADNDYISAAMVALRAEVDEISALGLPEAATRIRSKRFSTRPARRSSPATLPKPLGRPLVSVKPTNFPMHTV